MDRDVPVLLTGATGYLGAEILHDLLERGHFCLALVRPASLDCARERLREPLESGRLQLVPGDLVDPRCGLSDEAIDRLPRVDRAVHLGALACFAGQGPDSLHRANVGGTVHALDLARRLGAGAFFHFSTAFVAGCCRVPFGEDDLDVGQSFRNDYERTKLEAERAIADDAAAREMTVTVLRPSIVVGEGRHDSRHRRGLFGVLDILEWLRSRVAASGGGAPRFPVPGDPSVELNLIALEALTALFFRLFDDSSCWGGRYHLVHPEPVALGDLKMAFAQRMGLEGVDWESPGASPPANGSRSGLGAAFRRRLAPYLPYFASAPSWRTDRIEKAVPDWREICAAHAIPGSLGGLRNGPSVPAAARWVEDYFTRFIPAHTDDAAFTEVRRLDDVVGIEIEGLAPGLRLMRFRHEAFELLDGAPGIQPRCVFRLDLPTFRQVVAGQLKPQRAFFARRITISGEVLFALKIASLLEGFFRRRPYRESEVAVP